MLNHKRRVQALIGLFLSSILPSAWAAIDHIELPQPDFAQGSVFIYSDGHVEKLIQKGDSWYIVEDMRKRRYKKDLNFTLPPLEYQSLSSSYQQQVNSGDPSVIFPLDQSRPSGFSLKKDRPGKRQSILSWSCTQATQVKLKVMGKKQDLYKTRCSRIKWKKYYEVKEIRDLYYDPKSAWVVKTITRKKGKKRVRKLVSVLPPEKATTKAITKQLKKLKK